MTENKWMEWIKGHFLGVVVEVYLQAIIYTLHLIAINKHVFHMQSVVQEELKAPAKSENWVSMTIWYVLLFSADLPA